MYFKLITGVLLSLSLLVKSDFNYLKETSINVSVGGSKKKGGEEKNLYLPSERIKMNVL